MGHLVLVLGQLLAAGLVVRGAIVREEIQSQDHQQDRLSVGVGEASGARTLAKSAKSTRFKAAQWNPHGECFATCASADDIHCDHQYPKCKNGAKEMVDMWLTDKSMDFVGLELYYDAEPFRRDRSEMHGWHEVQHPCGGEKGPVFPYDVARLLVRKERWDLVGDNRGGCLQRNQKESGKNNYRAFVVQVVKHVSSGQNVVVAVAHFPHPNKRPGALTPRPEFLEQIKVFGSALKAAKAEGETDRVVVIADTNYADPQATRGTSRASSEEIMELLLGDVQDTGSSNTTGDTCCWPSYFGGSLDRIMVADFGKVTVHTTMPLGEGKAAVAFVAHNAHKPVVASFEIELSSAPSRFRPWEGGAVAAMAAALAALWASSLVAPEL